ncbi:unnamed protein product [Caenorhabditis angaria]|uniref:Uncharacterized protein n=1 Tax=Caenorhabditis angaria TaxID=860376 RepID=A0A9P1N3F3_9PELO|nr:unnamed protein product [Caenorhabditis angaria]
MDDSYENITSYKCAKPYCYQKPAYFMTGCKHFLCQQCCNGYGFHGDEKHRGCEICSKSSNCVTVAKVVESINNKRISLKRTLEQQINQLEGKTNELQRKTDELEAKKIKLDLFEKSIEDHLECSECDLTESEQRLQLCENCHGLEFDNLDGAKNCAICSSCSIKKHIRNGHNTVDFFPIFRSLHYENHSIKIKENMEHFENSRTAFGNDSNDFVDVNEKVKEQMDILTEMVRRSKSTKNQQLLKDKLNEFIEKSNTMAKTANFNLQKHVKEMGDQLEIMKKWNEDHQDYADLSMTD